MLKRISSPFVFLTIALALSASGCGPLIIAGGTGTAVIANDERTAGSFIEDQSIELKVQLQVQEEIGGSVNVNATSVNRRLLLTGQVPNKKLHDHVLEIVGNVENIREVLDELEYQNPSSFATRTADSVITAKVKATLCGIQREGFSCLDIKVVTENGIVYLMGLVTKEQEEIAVSATSHVSGILQVKKVFERIADDKK